MRYDGDHKQKTRERVLQEAASAIRAEGPHRVGVAEVMARAGLTHGGFYAHFASKEDFLDAAIGRMFEEGAAKLRRETVDRPPAAALGGYIDFYLSAEHRDSRTTGCPLPFLSADAPRLSDSSRQRFAQGVAGLTAALAELLTGLGRPNAEDEAASVLAEMVGALSLARAEPHRERADLILTRSKQALKRRLGLAD